MSENNRCWDKKFADRVAQLCVSKFNDLGKTGKPKDKTEWTPLSCIVKEEEWSQNLEVVALGTGSKCCGMLGVCCKGRRLQDSHAEVVARRAFMLYLVEQVQKAAYEENSILELQGKKFKIKTGITFHFYASHTPCGDASIFPKYEWTDSVGNEIKSIGEQFSDDSLHCGSISSDNVNTEPSKKKLKVTESGDVPVLLIEEHGKKYHVMDDGEVVCLTEIHVKQEHCVQEKPSSDIHRTGAKCVDGESQDPKLPGTNYHVTGVLRTKPGRGDPTLSMSCSDKMFKWTVMGVQGALLMLLLEAPVYIKTITIGRCPYSQEAMRRALFDRFKEKLKNIQLPDEFHISTPILLQSDIEFPYSRSCVAGRGQNTEGKKTRPSSTSLIWSSSYTHCHKHEVATNGHKLGATEEVQYTNRGMVSISRMSIFYKLYEFLVCQKYYTRRDINVRSYRLWKHEACNYHQAWETLKMKVLCNWTIKPENTMTFTADSFDW